MVRPYDGTGAAKDDLRTYFPDQRPPPDPGVFEFAIAAAGGTSTGAYIAGVLDFIIEALDEFEKAKASGDPNTPRHKVRLRNLTGTSAGGLSVGLASLFTFKRFPPVYNKDKWEALASLGLCKGTQEPELNTLYRAWVQEVDLDKLLAKPAKYNPDISSFAPAPIHIRNTVFAMVDKQPPRPWPDWAPSPLDLRITAGNLRGVPYSLTFEDQTTPSAGERLALHRDHVAFAVSNDGGSGAPDAHELNGRQFHSTPQWDLFGDVAIASSAIPLVFAPISVWARTPTPVTGATRISMAP